MLDDRAQSETIGTLLITAVVILSTATVGVGLLVSYDQQVSAEPPPADFRSELTATSLTLTHVGGENFPLAELDLVLRSDDGGERRYDLNDPADLQGATLDGDDLFEGGESVNVSHSLSGRVRILLVETSDGGAVLYDEYKTLTGDGVTPTPTPTATSTPNATATSTATATDTPTSTPTATSTTTTAPTAAPTNQPPTAEFAYNRKGNSENVDLDASPSTDSDGTIVQYQWDYGNDETIDATGQTLSQVKIASGTPVRLIVTDDDGATDEVVKTV